MTTTYADDFDGFLEIPRSDADILKPSMKAWTQEGDMVFAINAQGDRVVFRLVDRPGLPNPHEFAALVPAWHPEEQAVEAEEGTADDEAYVQLLEIALVAMLRTYCPDHRLVMQADVWEYWAGKPLTARYHADTRIMEVESVDTPDDM